MSRVEGRDMGEINLGVIIDHFLSCIMGLILLFYFKKFFLCSKLKEIFQKGELEIDYHV